MKITSKSNQLGLTLLEIMASLAIASVIMVAGANMADQRIQDIKDQNAAQYQVMVNNAAINYIKDNYSTLNGMFNAAPTTPITVNYAALVAGKYIAPSYATQSKNAYGQSECVLILRDSVNTNFFNTLVVTEGGENIPTGRLPLLSALIGANGGYIDPKTPMLATGTYGKWSLPLAPYGTANCSGTPTSTYKIASGLFFDNGNLIQDYLYRNAVPGHPEANTMNVPLVLQATQTADAACTSSGAIANAADGSLLSCSGTPLKWTSTGSAYWKDPVATKPQLDLLPCSATNVGETRIVKTPNLSIAGNTGPRAYSCNGLVWNPLFLDDNGNVTLPGSISTKTVKLTDYSSVEKTPCNNLGEIASDASGLSLSCQAFAGSKIWRAGKKQALNLSQNIPAGAGGTGEGFWRTVYSYTATAPIDTFSISGAIDASVDKMHGYAAYKNGALIQYIAPSYCGMCGTTYPVNYSWPLFNTGDNLTIQIWLWGNYNSDRINGGSVLIQGFQ